MTRVITYGTFDLFHEGHRRLLERARQHGDHLIVGVTTDFYDESRGKLNVRQTLMERIENVRRSGLADEIIIEERAGQKVTDIQRYDVDVFVIGSDWTGKFDYLSAYCQVVYLERTAGVSSTQLRDASGILRLGIAGAGRIAHRFVHESKFVSGVEVVGCFTLHESSARAFAEEHELSFAVTDFAAMLGRVDAVYLASPHLAHAEQVRLALQADRHVLCEKPLTLSASEAAELYALAEARGLVLLEAIKTAFAPGFVSMVAVARSGMIGEIKDVRATFTKLTPGTPREMRADAAGGSTTELASYPLLAIVKLLGTDFESVTRTSIVDTERGVDAYARLNVRYPDAMASATVGLGAKSEGDLVAAGTSGYLYVPAPWWKTESFELRFEDPRDTTVYQHRFDGDGLRYELAEFLHLITGGRTASFKLPPVESIAIARALQEARESDPIDRGRA